MNEKMILAQSFEQSPNKAVAELKEKFSSIDIKAITFFASSEYEPAELIATMNKAFPNISVFGCSTAGEIISGNITAGSIVAMAFTDELIEDFKVEVLDKINEGINLQTVVQSFEDHFSAPLYSLDSSKYFGLVYMDGLSGKEEIILDEIGNYTNVVFIGGSASDDFKYGKTIVYANGKYYDNGAVLALVKPKVAFGFAKVQSFNHNNGQMVTVTKLDETNRIIHELDNRPAVEVLSEIINVPIEQLAKTDFVHYQYSFGLFIDGQPYMRSVKQIINSSILLGCGVHKGMQLHILRATDMIPDTKEKWEQIKEKHKSISAVLTFNCLLRYYELNFKNQMQSYINIFSNVPIIGFCTYGEAMIGHMNHTATFLILE